MDFDRNKLFLEKDKSCQKTAHGLALAGGEHVSMYQVFFSTQTVFPQLHCSKINKYHLPKQNSDLQTNLVPPCFLLLSLSGIQGRSHYIYDSTLRRDCHTSSINSSDSCSIPCSCSSLPLMVTAKVEVK